MCMQKLLAKLMIIAATVYGFAPLTWADIRVDSSAQRDKESKDFFRLLSQLNHHSPIEAAGSHGSYGTSLGLGMVSTTLTENSDTQARAFNSNSETETGNLSMPKVFLVKGTPWPLDFGISFANLAATEIKQLSTHLQWTLLESLHLPAVALRGFYSKFYDMNNAEFDSAGVDVVASYGFLRYFTIYTGVGAQNNNASLYIPAGEATYDYETRESFVTQNSIVGLSISFLPPFVKASAEMHASAGGYRSVAGKINVQL